MGKSLAEEIAELPYPLQQEALEGIDLAKLEYDADFWLRPEQKIYEGDQDWFICAVIAGRGFGKTRLASEWIRRKAMENPGCIIGIAGRTIGDVRRIMVEGESGVLAVSPPEERPEFKRMESLLLWPNGSRALLFSSEAPDSARGPQFHYVAGDEFAAWKTTVDTSGATLYSNLIAATRLGQNPQILLTTTPKRTQVMKDINDRAKHAEEKIKVVRGSTLDNSNLPASFIENLLRQYGDSDLAKQEIEGIMLDDAQGIVFTKDMIVRAKAGLVMPHYPLKIIAVDPSVSADPKTSDECGIVAMASTTERDLTRRRAVLLEDYSLRATPDIWAQQVVEAAKEQGTKNVVVEKNQGGDLLRMVIQAKDPTLNVFPVTATKGKVKRAEPVVVLMQQSRIHFAQDFDTLEQQLEFYDPEDSNYSPDRMDAFVWGATALMVAPPPGLRTPSASSYNPANTLLSTSRLGTGRTRATSSVKRPY